MFQCVPPIITLNIIDHGQIFSLSWAVWAHEASKKAQCGPRSKIVAHPCCRYVDIIRYVIKKRRLFKKMFTAD
jgi:hypothetical protein